MKKDINTEYVCDGSCCERFYEHHSPEEIWSLYEEYVLTGVDKGDISIIGPMVTPLEKAEGSRGWWYSCKHWDAETRRCRIYEARPKMCRDYPYGEPCKYCDSTCGTVKSEPLPPGGVSGPPDLKGQ